MQEILNQNAIVPRPTRITKKRVFFVVVALLLLFLILMLNHTSGNFIPLEEGIKNIPSWFAPQTKIANARILAIERRKGNGRTLNQFKLISFSNGERKEETIIEQFLVDSRVPLAGISDALIVGDMVYYTFILDRSLMLTRFDLRSGNSTTVVEGRINDERGSSGGFSTSVVKDAKLIYFAPQGLLALLVGNRLRLFYLQDIKNPQMGLYETALFYQKQNPTNQYLNVFTLGPGSDKQLWANEGNSGAVNSAAARSIRENLLMFLEPVGPDVCFEPISAQNRFGWSTPFSCNPIDNYSCKPACPTEAAYRVMNSRPRSPDSDIGPYNRTLILKDPNSYLQASLLAITDYGGCSAAIIDVDPRPCVHYTAYSIRKIVDGQSQDLYRDGGFDTGFPDFSPENLRLSTDENYVTYSRTLHCDPCSATDRGITESDAFVLDIRGKHKPLRLLEHGYVFYFEEE